MTLLDDNDMYGPDADHLDFEETEAESTDDFEETEGDSDDDFEYEDMDAKPDVNFPVTDELPFENSSEMSASSEEPFKGEGCREPQWNGDLKQTQLAENVGQLIEAVNGMRKQLAGLEGRIADLEKKTSQFEAAAADTKNEASEARNDVKEVLNKVFLIYTAIYSQDLGAVTKMRREVAALREELNAATSAAKACEPYMKEVSHLNAAMSTVYGLCKDKINKQETGVHTRSNGLKDKELIDYLKEGYTNADIAILCKKKGLQYTRSAINYRVKKLLEMKDSKGNPFITKEEIEKSRSSKRAAQVREKLNALEVEVHKPAIDVTKYRLKI